MTKTSNYSSFLWLTAICSFLGAVTTTLLIFLPRPEAADFEAQVLLSENSLYLSRLWILFIHPQVNILASLGIAFLLLRKHPLQIISGTLFLLVWAYTEMAQQALLIDTLNQLWRPGYASTDTDAAKAMYRTLIEAAGGISDSHYFLVIYGFGIGSLLHGLALVRTTGLGKWIGISLLFIGVLSLSSFARYYAGFSSLNAVVDWCYEWIYSYLQPLVRVAIGVWIIKEMGRTQAISQT